MRIRNKSWFQLPAIWWALRRARALLERSVARALQLDPPTAARRPLERATADRLAATLFAVGRRMRRCACLPQSIALANLLRARGVAARVIVGAEKSGNHFAAHAWVESDLGVFDPAPARLGRFTRLERFPGPATR